MPYSDASFDKRVEKFLASHSFCNYLDIGPGAGKYGKIIRKVHPEAIIEAIEVDKSYIKQFNLKTIYNKVYHSQVEKYFIGKNTYMTEVVIIGDCIEHLKKSDGIDLLNFLVYRTHYIVVIFPSKYIQFPLDGHERETHISIWSKHDFVPFDHKFFTKKTDFPDGKTLVMNLAIIKGFLEDSQIILVK